MLTWLSQRRLLLALPLVVLLLSSSASAASAAASSDGAEDPILTPAPLTVLDTSVIQGRPLRIVLAGSSGAGKTLFCEFLCFALRSSDMTDPAQASAEFLRWRDGRPDTHRVTKYTETLRGGGSVEIYDTPGLLSTDDADRDMEHIKELMASIHYVDAVLLVFDGDEEHISDKAIQYVLEEYSAFFPPSVHANIALLFSHLRNRGNFPWMRFEPHLEAKFRFTSKAVKSRSFFVDNPLHAGKELLDPNAEGQTVASLLQRTSDCRRYNDAVQELNRLLQYLAKLPRWTNQDVSTDLFLKRAEAELQASNLRAGEESRKRAEAELQLQNLRAELREKEESKKSAEDELEAAKRRAGEETKQRDQADRAMKQELEKRHQAVRVEMEMLRVELKRTKLQEQEERKKRDEADLAINLRVKEERAEAERQVRNLREELGKKEKSSAEDELHALKLRAREEKKERDEAEWQVRQLQKQEESAKRAKVERQAMLLRAELKLMKLRAEDESKKRAEADQLMLLRAEDESRKRAEAAESKLGPGGSASALESSVFARVATASAVVLLVSAATL